MCLCWFWGVMLPFEVMFIVGMWFLGITVCWRLTCFFTFSVSKFSILVYLNVIVSYYFFKYFFNNNITFFFQIYAVNVLHGCCICFAVVFWFLCLVLFLFALLLFSCTTISWRFFHLASFAVYFVFLLFLFLFAYYLYIYIYNLFLYLFLFFVCVYGLSICGCFLWSSHYFLLDWIFLLFFSVFFCVF